MAAIARAFDIKIRAGHRVLGHEFRQGRCMTLHAGPIAAFQIAFHGVSVEPLVIVPNAAFAQYRLGLFQGSVSFLFRIAHQA